MKLLDIYREAINIGVKNDPRGRDRVEEALKEAKNRFQELPEKEKVFFDKEKLTNPYADTRILWGSSNTEVKSIFVGIDIEGPEMLLVDRLKDKGSKVDLVIAHHPEGIALANLADVMQIHSDILSGLGVSVSVAESIMSERISEVQRRLMPANHARSFDFARILGIPFMTIHTAADNCVTTYLKSVFDREKPKNMGDIIGILLKIEEYKESYRFNAGPKIIVGSEKSKVGKILVDMTGGTEPSKEIFANIANAGISTVVCMHISEEHFKKAKESHVNVIIAGHIASDSLGLNLVFDYIEKKEKFNFVECSGFKRIRRIKK
ncbi:MAG: NGG1p interacting factor NIF3 [Candidatus Omnitrophica bacterium]|nr:NGG1p interacting factor NIF3 [Candidatus Omnitrophota bacterium]